MKNFFQLILLAFLSWSCTQGVNLPKRATKTAPQKPEISTDSVGNPERSGVGKPNLIWKRYRSFERGLMAALELKDDELCTEASKYSCINKAHLTILGGNEPIEIGQYERAESPSVLTSVAVDRVIISACNRRIALDRQSTPKVFTKIDFKAQSVESNIREEQAIELYRRFLARDPSAEEQETLKNFSFTNSSPEKVSLILCYAIASQAEYIFI